MHVWLKIAALLSTLLQPSTHFFTHAQVYISVKWVSYKWNCLGQRVCLNFISCCHIVLHRDFIYFDQKGMSKWASVFIPMPTSFIFVNIVSEKWNLLMVLICISFVWNWTSLHVFMSHLYFFLESETSAFLLFPEVLLPGWQLFVRCYLKCIPITEKLNLKKCTVL